MSPEEIERVAVPHLAGQFERGLPVLFTGSGFSRSARNILGQPVPLVLELKESLWRLCFPGREFAHTAALQELFDYALIRHRAELTNLLTSSFTVDADTLPEWYARLYSLAWFRSYTLNIDDLAEAVLRHFKLPRHLDVLSATSERLPKTGGYPVKPGALDVVHLNGKLSDIPSNVTFSVTQYADRLARQEPWYVRLAAELVSHSFVFIGTQLDESPLWQHLALRRARGSWQLRELRPRSYLVTPALNPAREALLAEYNVAWISMDTCDFVKRVLSQMEKPSAVGLATFSQVGATLRSRGLADVATLSRNPEQKTEYLLGAQPMWADLQSGRAIQRAADERLWNEVSAARQSQVPGVLIVTGTAGSGKSTALMRACLRLSSEGLRIGWADTEQNLTPREIKTSVRSADAADVVAIDDADVYGSELSPLIREITTDEPYPLLLLAVRSGRMDRVVKPQILNDVPMREFTMPHLADDDIDGLIGILDRENRLGLLQGKSHREQRYIFRELAGRQLLVAMIKATSGKDLEEKAVEELVQLDSDSARIYGLVSVASSFRIGLYRDEIMVGVGDTSNKP